MQGDPSTDGGYVEVHQQLLPMIIRSDSLSLEDEIMVRVFKSSAGYKLEFTSEMNISFFYLKLISTKEMKQLVG